MSHSAGNALEVRAPPSLRLYPRPPIDETMHQPLETYTMIKILDLPLLANSTFSFKAWRLVLSNLVRYQTFNQHFFSLLNLRVRYSVLFVYFSKKKSKNGSFLLNILTL